jgi:hypothetical protein
VRYWHRQPEIKFVIVGLGPVTDWHIGYDMARVGGSLAPKVIKGHEQTNCSFESLRSRTIVNEHEVSRADNVEFMVIRSYVQK